MKLDRNWLALLLPLVLASQTFAAARDDWHVEFLPVKIAGNLYYVGTASGRPAAKVDRVLRDGDAVELGGSGDHGGVGLLISRMLDQLL